MTRHLPKGGLALLALLAGAACGDDETEGLAVPLLATRDATAAECPDGGTVVESGFDDDGDGRLVAAEVRSSETVCNPPAGDPGGTGDPGQDALVTVTEEPPGANCAFGGQRIQVGIDEDANGVLDAGEVLETSYVCDGAPGPDGLGFLVRTSTVVDEACEAGGLRIESGLDLDRDGTLGDDEVDATVDVCAGVDGFDALVDVAAEPPGSNCPAGGQRVRRGVDRNRSGQLEPTEVEATTYLCNPVATLVTTASVAPGADCDLGGVRIDSGLDVDADGTLAPAEINATRFLCEGPVGDDALVTVTATAAGGACEAGGLEVSSGFDLDADGVLDPTEVTATSYLCNASPGLDGRGTSAVRVRSEPPGPSCPQGGTRIETGPDTNGDGQLQDGEVTETRFACDGEPGAALFAIEAIPPGPICLNGGQRLLEGLDADGDGLLDPSEVSSTTEVCSAQTAVPMAIATTALPAGFRSAPYEGAIEALGGFGGNYEWSIRNGSLPPGLSIDATGTPATAIRGTATATGTFGFDVVVTDGFGSVAARTFTLTLSAPPCEPGRNGVVGETLTTLTAPSSFGSGITGVAADDQLGGFIYVIDSGRSLERFRKDASLEEDVLALLPGISGGDINSVHVIGSDIFLTNDSTSCSTDCIRRISTDRGQTFSVQDLGDFSRDGGTNDALQGVAVTGTTLWTITNDPVEAQLWSIDLGAASFPTTATLAATLSTIDTCNGLGVDDRWFYTACDDIGDGSEGLVRIDRTTFATEPVASLTLSISSGSWGNVEVVDIDGDGAADVAYVQGDNNSSTTGDGATYYVCNPAGTTPAFAGPFGAGTADDEGLGYDRSTNSLWQIDESSTNIFRFD